MCICFGSKEACVEGSTNSNYVGDMDKRGPISSYVFMFTSGAMSWQSHLKNCTSLSTTKGEYIGVAEACKKAIWLAHLVKDSGMIV